jgi:hypothetical protein
MTLRNMPGNTPVVDFDYFHFEGVGYNFDIAKELALLLIDNVDVDELKGIFNDMEVWDSSVGTGGFVTDALIARTYVSSLAIPLANAPRLSITTGSVGPTFTGAGYLILFSMHFLNFGWLASNYILFALCFIISLSQLFSFSTLLIYFIFLSIFNFFINSRFP